MGRYIKDVRLEQPIDVVSMVMDDFIYHNRFSRTDWNGEMVFYLKDRHKKERYMKWVYVDGLFHVEAWLKNSFGGETDLDGVGGGASKREFRASIDGLIETLKKTAAGSLAGGHIGSDPLHHNSGHVDNHDVWKADTGWQQSGDRSAGQSRQQSGGQSTGPYRQQSGGQSTSPYRQQSAAQPAGQYSRQAGNAGRSTHEPEERQAMLYAVLAMVTGWFFPLAGIIFIVLARRKAADSSNTRVINVLCILAVVFMVFGFVGNIMFSILWNTFF